MESRPTVFVVDDDTAVRNALRLLMKSVSLDVEAYSSAQEFLDAYEPDRPGCLVLDVRMAGVSGPDLQEKLLTQQISIPIVMITGHGDVPTAVRAMRAGAVDFLEKPFNDQVLLDRINYAIEQDRQNRREQARRADAAGRLALLTPREHEVTNLLVAGKSSKGIAFELGLSGQTVNLHRGHIMAKLEIDSVADLVRMAHIGGVTS